MKPLKGVIHGKAIELEEETGLPEGQEVAVEIRPIDPATAWLERIVVDPAISPGKPVIKGTSVAAEEVARLVDEGKTDAEIRQRFPGLSAEDVSAVRRYASVPAGLRKSFGAWAEDAEELDEYLEWNRQQRTLDRREVAP